MPRSKGQSKYTPERAKRALDAIRLGATLRLAALYAGVTDDTLINWRHRYSEFSDALREAEGAGLVGWLAKIEKAANDGDWRAAAWKAERRYPQEYGRRVEELVGAEGGPISFTLSLGDAKPHETEHPRLNGHVNGKLDVPETEISALSDGSPFLP